MGVSGTGKSTIGTMLSEQLGIPFFDGDDYHPEANVKKMSAGRPLNDHDRQGWLLRLNELAKEYQSTGAVIACSALKQSYRDLLRQGMNEKLAFVFLEGSFELIKSRLESRKGHFMTSTLLQSQFDTLEPPEDAITVSIALQPTEITEQVIKQLE
ncbi:gluconokinase [Flagellimonas algicola]|uniref:Gluconokinase n=2 Tax=Flagellimonas algicola TaxID=2583815 RepID=A0ABY2WRS3_9FLAO|nr:gluconokinase [Allomuricauda algicola]